MTPTATRIIALAIRAGPAGVRREAVREALWPDPDREPDDWQGCLRVHCHNARRALGDRAGLFCRSGRIWFEVSRCPPS